MSGQATCIGPSPAASAPNVFLTMHLLQGEVEQYFLVLGTLYPTFYRMYWLGLRTNASAWPDFEWLMRTFPMPDGLAYTHWATRKGGREPNNAVGVEYCAGADATAAYDGAWGWADFNCSATWPFMCRLQGGLHSSSMVAAACTCSTCIPPLKIGLKAGARFAPAAPEQDACRC